MDDKPARFLRRPEVERRTGLRHTQLDTIEQAGRFPKRVKISDRAAGWIESEIDAWIAERIAASRSSAAESSVARPSAAPRPPPRKLVAHATVDHQPPELRAEK